MTSDEAAAPVAQPAGAIAEKPGHPVAGRFRWILHVYAAFAMALAAPMYGRLEQRTPYLVTLETVTIFAFVLVWSVVAPGLVLLALAGLRRLSPRAGEIALPSVLGVLTTLILLGILGQRVYGGGLGWITLLASIAGGVFVARGYRRWTWLHSILTFVAVGSVLFPVSLIWVFLRDSARPVVKVELTAETPVPVVMVVFDCFCGVSLMGQNRRIDVHRYPHFAELANTCNWYRNCSAVHPRTLRAIPAILSGALSAETQSATIKEYPQNLFTLLKATGRYELTSFEPFTLLCPPDRQRDRPKSNPWLQWITVSRTVGLVILHDMVPADLPFDTPLVPRIWFALDHASGADRQQRRGLIRYSWDIGRDEQFRHFMDCIGDSEQLNSDQLNLWFGHFALPHYPWCYLPSGHRYQDDVGLEQVWGTEGKLSEDWADDELAVLQAHQQHLLQEGFTDKLLGELIDRLRRDGLFDRCLLVVMADHGISFRAGLSGRLPTEKNLADVMSVPLFIKLPGQKVGDVVDLNVETTDVLPTILDVLKLTPPTPLPGQSLISPDFVERPVKTFTDDEHVFKIDGQFEARYDILIQQLARFGTGDDPLRIFKIGPHSELLGRRLDELTLADDSTIKVHPVNFEPTFERAADNRIPARLQAMIDGQSTLPVQFAVAVNDVIWGTTQTYRARYLQHYWSVMLPESAIQDGRNQFRIFQIEDSPQGLRLSECSIGPSAARPELPIEY
jgi:hypothetical protein